MRTIYLDYNTTTPTAVSVQDAVRPFLEEHFGDPCGSHALARATREALEDARLRVARLLGCRRPEIVFTSGGTESNNLALIGTAFRVARGGSGHIVFSAIEHASVAQTGLFLESLGYDVTIVPPDERGIVRPEVVRSALRPNTFLVSVQLVNGDVGIIEPVGDIARLCHDEAVLCHTDASQAMGKISVQVANLAVDLLTISGHKMYAPKGIGALYVRRGVPIGSLMHGEPREAGLRPGMEGVALAVGLGAAASLVEEDLQEPTDAPSVAQGMGLLRDHLSDLLRRELGEQLRIHGEGVERVPNTLSVCFADVAADDMLRRIPELCAWTVSSHFASFDATLPVLDAIGCSHDEARGTLRLSLGRYTKQDDVERAAGLLLGAWEAAHFKA